MALINTLNPTPIAGSTKENFIFGQPALIAMFRGAGGLLGSSSGPDDSGINVLNAQLQNTFQDYYLTSQVFDSFEGNVLSFSEIGSAQGQAFLNRFNGQEALGLLGYSAGGLSAIRLAKAQAPRAIKLLLQLDTFEPLTGNDPEDEVLPTNVSKGINYYQNRNRFNLFGPGYDPLDLQGARNVKGSENIDAEKRVGDRSITHRNIDDNAKLRTQILANFEEFLLRDLAFDPMAQLTLGGGAQRLNNILSLAPGADTAPGEALIAQPIAINPEFSFSSQFEFRLETTSSILPGFSFWIQPVAPPHSAPIRSPLAITFNPTSLNASPLLENAVAVLTPVLSPEPLAQAIAPLDLDSNTPITAWVDYDGPTDQLSVFLSDTLNQPRVPLVSTVVDLAAIAGAAAQFGFQAIVGNELRQAELLTWQLDTTISAPVPPTTLPDTYLNLGLTQRAASAFLGIDLPFTPFEVGGLEFSTLFDEAFYLRLNPDVLSAVVEGTFATGYDHFTQLGWLEGRRPSSLFDEAFYRASNPDVNRAVNQGGLKSGLQHFAYFGHREGRDPSARFDQSEYLLNYRDVANAVTQGTVLSAFEHYIEHGASEGRNPQLLLFQEQYYLKQNPDVAAAVAAGGFTDGFAHYLTFGCREGRNPSSFFQESSYLALNPDVAAAVEAGTLPCGWAHYLTEGRF